MTNEQFDWKKKHGEDKEDVYFYNGRTDIVDPKFEGRVTRFPDQLKSGNVSIRIKPVKKTDGGTYICKYPKKDPEIRGTVELKVGE